MWGKRERVEGEELREKKKGKGERIVSKFTKILGPIFIIIIFAFSAGAVNANEILGNWKTESGETANISKCGSAFCIVLKTGKYKGQSIGKLTLDGKKYTGTVRDPADDKTYSGSASIVGNTLKLQGCFMIFCKTQRWTRL